MVALQLDEASLTKLDGFMRNARKPTPQVPVASNLIAAARRRLIKQLLKREFEGLRFYEALPLALLFHACNAQWRLLDGSNRAGKTLAAAIEDARVLCGCDPYDKYPKHNGLALFVGLERKHLTLMYRTMFLPGAIKIIPDEDTKLYRSVRYDRNNPTQLQEYDLAYREKWKDAPPLVPPRMVKRTTFEMHEVPRSIEMRNGWRSIWQSAAGKPPQGDHINHGHFDEEMPDAEFYKETHRGLTRNQSESIQHRPKGIWSATSQVANIELAELRDRADADPESDLARRFVFTIENNPYFSPEARKEFFDGLSEEDRETRYRGIPATQVRRLYATYNPMGDSDNGSGHGCEPFEIDPKVFCRYVIVDPALNHCATLFVAIDSEEKYLTVYDGFELPKGSTGRDWAAEVKKRQQGVKFEYPVIDQQMGREGLIARETTTVAKEYAASLKEAGVQFRQRGRLEGFFPGSNDVCARVETLRSLMEVRGDGPFEGTCRLRVMRGIVPELDKQLRRAQTDPKNPEKPYKNPRVPQDFRDTLEYAAAANLGYHPPQVEEKEDEKPNPYQLFLRREQRRKAREQAARRRRQAVA